MYTDDVSIVKMAHLTMNTYFGQYVNNMPQSLCDNFSYMSFFYAY